MKKLFFVLALLIMGTFISSQGAFATCTSDTDKADFTGWCIDQFGELQPKSITTGGTQTNNQGGMLVPVLVVTNPTLSQTLTSQQSGIYIVDMGGVTSDTLTGSGGKYILPRAVVGLMYTLSTGPKETVTLDTLDTTDTFLFSSNGTGLNMGDSLKSPGQAGDTITVVCAQAGRWAIAQMHGSSSSSTTIDTLWLANGTN